MINYPVFSKLYGRLGNNLFQLATGLAHSIEQRTNFFIMDEWKYDSCLSQPLLRSRPPEGIEKYKMPEDIFYYKPIPYTARLLDGYFQSEKYFKKHKTNVINFIEFHNRYSYMNENQVAVHIRRGDYLNLNMYHPVLKYSYYKWAFEWFGRDKEYIIFTDDTEWVENNFIPYFTELGYRVKVLISKYLQDDKLTINKENEFFELKLMSTFQNFIIANSSYSWWGAWLSEAKNKTVIAPKQWFGPNYSHLDTTDLLPEEWIKC